MNDHSTHTPILNCRLLTKGMRLRGPHRDRKFGKPEGLR